MVFQTGEMAQAGAMEGVLARQVHGRVFGSLTQQHSDESDTTQDTLSM